MRATTKAVLGLAALAALGVVVTGDDPRLGTSTAVEQPAAESTEPATPAASVPGSGATLAQPPASGADLLQSAGDGDGDSWHDTAGRESRLGLVNTPETNECFGADATAKRKELTAGGFLADVYTTDAYSRSVAVVSLADGTNLNVWLARHGYANDKYLQEFRAENPALSGELDQAFAAAKAERAGF